MLGKALGAPNNVFSDAEGGFNNPAIRAAEIPAANGVTNARSLARFYAGLTGTVEGGPSEPLLTEEQVAKASELQTSGPDKCLFFETTFGLGFFVASLFAPYGGERSFGHTGAGGSVGFTDPEHGIGFGYVMNKMMAGPQRRPPLGRAHPAPSTRPSASRPPTSRARDAGCPTRHAPRLLGSAAHRGDRRTDVKARIGSAGGRPLGGPRPPHRADPRSPPP